MDKSADAFRTISEVAEHLETPAHVLRFWESRFPQIRPVKRAGGRRYYRPSDVSLLTGIKRLLHDEGMTIRGVQKILREQGVRHVSGLSGDAGDAAGDDIIDAPFVDLIEDVVVQPAPFRPAPGLPEAMAKMVHHGPFGTERTAAPSLPLANTEAAQGALLLTPAQKPEAVSEPKVAISTELADRDADQDGATADRPSTPNDPVISEALAEQAAISEAVDNNDDFDEDDFETGPPSTLASRIRALPKGISVGRVGAELMGVVARLQALRDAMADAGPPGRS